MKRILFLLVTLLTCHLIWAYDFSVDYNGKTIYFTKTSSTEVAVSYGDNGGHDSYSNEYTGTVVIPSTVTYSSTTYSVTSIGESAFCYCSDLKEVTIPNSVTKIGGWAFRYCNGLTSMTIPNSVTSIEYGAFYGCSSLTSLTIPNSVTSIENATFYGCTGLTSVTIPNSVTSIGFGAFGCCTKLTSLTIPNSLTSIDNCAFQYCSGLTSVTIPNSVTSIGSCAFDGCTGLTKVEISDIASWCAINFQETYSNPLSCAHHLYLHDEEITELTIPNSVSSIGNYAFDGCIGLTEVNILEPVTSIGSSAFSNCSNLASLTIPNSVTSISNSAFSGCSSLTSLTIPNSVTTIGDAAFKNTGLKTLRIEAGDQELTLTGSVFTNSKIEQLYIGRNLSSWTALCKSSSLKEVEIGGETTTIGDYAFGGCSGLTTVTIGRNVASLGRSSFRACTELKNLVIEDSGTELYTYNSNWNYYPFSECKIVNLYVGRNLSNWTALCNSESLINLEFGSFVTTIGYEAFRNCSGLTSVNIPNSVTSIGGGVFSYCTGLTEVSLSESLTSISYFAFAGCSSLTSVTIPNSVTTIENDAFYYCRSLNSVTIPESVTSIEASSFYGCTGLTAVTIPNSVTSIGENAFGGCGSLMSLTIPNSVTSISQSAFSDCSSLKALTIEDGDSELSLSSSNSKYYPFKGCLIESLYVGRNLSSWGALCLSSSLKDVTIGDIVTSIGSFSGCTNLTSVILGSSVTSIGSSAFYDCTGLTVVTIPNSVTSIGSYAFAYCTGLTAATIPNSVTSIGEKAFLSCTSLTSVTIPSSVTSIGAYAFLGCKYLSVDLSKSVATIDARSFNEIKSLIVGEKVNVSGSASYPGIINLVWLANSQPSISGAKVSYTASSLDYLSSWFKVDGFTYVPLSPSERTCILIDCDYIANGDTSITLPEKVTYKGIEFTVSRLGDYLMARQDKITEVKLRDRDEAIPSGMFYYCTTLQEFKIPAAVKSLGSEAFSGCDSLTAMIIPESVTSIGSNVFAYCTGLSFISIPESVSSIGNAAFLGCTGLTSVDIPNSITSISSNVFSGCSNLTSVTIPESVTSIGSSAFYNCSGLSSVTIPESVTSIGSSAFYNCSGLSSVTIPNSVTSIGSEAFRGCTSLTSVTIPSSVTSIYNYAFNNCPALIDVVLEDGEKSINISSDAFGEGIENLRIGRNLSNIDVFAGISTLKTAWVTDIPTAIAAGTFQGCSNLDFVYVGDNVTAIGDRAFSGCSSLKLFQFGKNVTSIGANALADCSGITNIYAESLTPPTVATQALDDLDRWSCSLHVPAAAMDAYKAADQWKEFFFYDSDFAIALSDEAISLEPGQTFQLTAYIDSEHTSRAAVETDVRWVSTNPNVAVVDQNGFVVGTGSGKCSIAAFNSDNVMANCVINIDTEVERVITLDTYNLEIDINETHQFHANVDAATLTWSSSNPDVAEIDSDGSLTAKSPGTTLITATNGNGDSSSCFVTVRDKSTAIENVSNDSIDIRVEGSELVIEGLPDDALVHVFTLDGKLVYSGYERRIALQSGTVYIVVYPGGTLKIAL